VPSSAVIVLMGSSTVEGVATAASVSASGLAFCEYVSFLVGYRQVIPFQRKHERTVVATAFRLHPWGTPAHPPMQYFVLNVIKRASENTTSSTRFGE
jgi:hypothetical protein